MQPHWLARFERAVGLWGLIVASGLGLLVIALPSDPEGTPIALTVLIMVASTGLFVMTAGELSVRYPERAILIQLLPCLWIVALVWGGVANILIRILT